ncbi:MAG: transposase [Verrucomicrobiota bacterium]
MIISTSDRLQCLTDEIWAGIEDCFPRANGRKGFEQEIPSRTVLEAVIFRARAGCPWRDLPTAYGFWHTIYMRWTRWVEAGVPAKVMVKLHAQKEAKGELSSLLVLLDSTIVRAHQHAAGALKKKARKPSVARAAA